MKNDPLNLRNLPAPAPPEGLWQSIETALDDAPRGRARRHLPAAVAASLALVMVSLQLPNPPDDSPMPSTAPNAELQLARAASARLEQVLRHQRDGVLEASAVESLAWMEYELGWLDMQLAEQPGDVELWRQRAGLLERMNRTYQQNDWRAEVRLASF